MCIHLSETIHSKTVNKRWTERRKIFTIVSKMLCKMGNYFALSFPDMEKENLYMEATVPLAPQKKRELLFQLLYAIQYGASDEEVLVDLIAQEAALPKKAVEQLFYRVAEIYQLHGQLDQIIAALSISHELERIHSTERVILRLALYELIYDKELPPKVAIAEAVRLARKFSTPEAANYVNSLLDVFWQESQAGQPSSLAAEVVEGEVRDEKCPTAADPASSEGSWKEVLQAI